MNRFSQLKINLVLFSLCLVSMSGFATTTTVISPANGSVGVRPNMIALTAKTVMGALSYKIDISTSNTFATIFQTHTNSSNTQGFVDLAYGTRYYVRVSIDGGATYGSITSFITATPVITSPSNGSSGINPGLVNITSQLVPTATQYTIELSTSSAFTNVITNGAGTNSQQFGGLAYGTKYFVRVKTDLQKSDLSFYGYGNVTMFTTGNPVVTNPVNGASGIGPASVLLTTKTITGASSYTIELSTTNTFTNVIKALGPAGATSQLFVDLAYGTRYFVRVKTDLPAIGYGTTTSFVTATPKVTSPMNGAMGVNPASASLTSTTIPGADKYYIELCTKTDFVNILIDSGSNVQVFSGLLANTKYFARVKTNLVKSDGITRYGFGPITSFTTGAMPAAALNNNPSSASFEAQNISVFPNPSRDVFNLRADNDVSQTFGVQIFDATSGNQVHSSQLHTNVTSEVGRELKSGRYIIHITTPAGVQSFRVVKE